MNVLHLISSRLGYYGAERMVVTLASALEQVGVSCVIVAFHDPQAPHLEVIEQGRRRGLKAEQITCRGRIDRDTVRSLRELIKHHNIDVIHCHGIKPVLYALLAGCETSALVSTCHLWTFNSAKEWLLASVERCLLHAVDRVVVVSDQILPELRRFGIKADVIFNGIDVAPVIGASSLRRTMAWNDRPIIASVARLAPQKGLQYLMQAAPEVLRTHPEALFILAGDGPARQSLETQAKNLGIQDSVQFLGVRNDIPDILACIDILAMPSISEGLPMALLEAMAAAKPIVASAVGAVPRVIEDRVNGMLFPVGDSAAMGRCLDELLTSRELCLKLGRNARRTVETKFSADSMASQYGEVYLQTSLNKLRPAAAL